MTTRLQAATEKLRQRIDGRYEARRQAATATVTDVARDPVTGHTSGTVTATIDGVSNQRVFVGAGTGVRVGDNLRVENRGSGVAPEWIMLGKDGSPAGAEGVVDVERLLSTPGALTLASDAYAATNGAGILANVTAQWSQTPDWEAPAYYEVSYYRYADGASKAHVSRAPHTNGATTAQISILNLLPGTEYVVAVRAVGYGGGLSAWTAEQSIITATDATVPAVPSGLAASEVGVTSLRFTWSRNAEADFWYYEIGVSTSAGTGGMLAGYPRSAGDTPEHVATVTPVTNYYFRVRALDTSGNASAWSGWSGPHATALAPVDVIDIATLIDTDYGLGIKPSGKIGIDLASPSGLSFAAGDLRIDDSIAGAGLGIANKVLSVGAGNGISVAADSVAVNQGYAFAWTANHSWTGSLQHPSYASQVSNWQISAAGAADFRYLFADEMHVKSFVADLEQALAGGQIISKSVAVLSRNFTAPAAGATATLYVWDLPSAENMAVFQSGDVVRIRSFSRAAGNLSVADCWGVVTSYSNLTGKEQSWTFTRSTAPNAGAMSAGSVVQADALVLDYGTTGNGYHEVNAIDGTYAANSPYSQVVTWTGHPATGQTVRTRTGNLTGLAFPSQPANEYGFYAGDGRAVGDKYIRISTWGAELHNLPLNLYSGSTAVISINPSHPSTGGASIGVGANANNLTYHANAGIFAGWDNTLSAYVMKIGNDDQYLKWNGSELEISGIIRVVNGGDINPPKYIPKSVLFDGFYIEVENASFANVTRNSVSEVMSGWMMNGLGEYYELWITQETFYRLGGSPVVLYAFKSAIDSPDTSPTGADRIYLDAASKGEWEDAVDKHLKIPILYIHLNEDASDYKYVMGAGDASYSIITPEFIQTPSISAISANLGNINAGSIEVGSTNKLWLNVGGDSLKLAIGGSVRTSAPFRVYETGKTIIGDTGGSYLQWESPTLTLRGNIDATSGTLSALTVTGDLSVGDTGRILWAGGWGKLEQNGIVYHNKVGGVDGAVLRIGKPSSVVGVEGLVDINMFAEAAAEWNYAIHINDGGHNGSAESALYHGRSTVSSPYSIDRIFDAYSANSTADGYFGKMNSVGVWAGNHESSYFSGKGAVFKGEQLGQGPVALFNKSAGTHNHPAVWATVNGSYAAPVYYALVSGSSVRGIDIDSTNVYGYEAIRISKEGFINMGYGTLKNVGVLEFRSGAGVTSTSLLSGATPRFDASVKVRIEGDPRDYYIPLLTIG